jgi:hypothetical protein
VYETVLNSGLDLFVFAILFSVILLAVFLRLDERFVKAKHKLKPQRPAPSVDKDGQPIFFDPDGRPWRAPRLRREA